MTLQKINPEKYVEIWSDVVFTFLSWCPRGIVVFRPVPHDRKHRVIDDLKSRFAHDGRFFIDAGDDNKFWISRARYFVTDYSEGFTNFCLSAKRPAIRMVYSEKEAEPSADEWGWTIGRPGQVVPLLEKMDMDAQLWEDSLVETQQREMPTLGHNFALMAVMLKRILENDDDPAWYREDKGHTPCDTPGDLLRLAGKVLQNSSIITLHLLRVWLADVLSSTENVATPKIWLPLLKRAMLPKLVADSSIDCDSPRDIAYCADSGLEKALDRLPSRQVVGLVRHCLRKNASLAAISLLITASSAYIPGPHKKRALFFLLMEWHGTTQK